MFLYKKSFNQLVSDSKFNEKNFHHIAHFGIRLILGISLIVAGIAKFNTAYAGSLTSLGIPGELQIAIASLQFLIGFLLIIGIFTRIVAGISFLMDFGNTFVLGQGTTFSGEGGIEGDLLRMAVSLVILAAGPGKISVSQIVKKIPRILQ